MSESRKDYFVNLADCAAHYMAIKRGGQDSYECPICKNQQLQQQVEAVRFVARWRIDHKTQRCVRDLEGKWMRSEDVQTAIKERE